MGLLKRANDKVRQDLVEYVHRHRRTAAGTCTGCKASLATDEDEFAHQVEIAYRLGKNNG